MAEPTGRANAQRLLPLALAALLGACTAPAEPPRRQSVDTSAVQLRRFADTINTVATLEAEAEVKLASQAGGRVERLLVRSGERVSRGQLLLVLDQTQQQARVASLRAREQRDRLNYQRYEQLVRQGAASAIDRDAYKAEAIASREELRASLADLTYRDLRAPIDGVLGDIEVKVGDVVRAGDPFSTILRNERLLARLDLPAPAAARVREGLTVQLFGEGLDQGGEQSSNQGGERELSRGAVVMVDPRLDSGSQGLLVKAAISNPQGKLRDGQRLRARIVLAEGEAPAVPFSAVTRLAGQPFVFVAGNLAQLRRDPGRTPLAPLKGLPESTPVALQRPVRLGELQDGQYPVLGGLEPGQRLITSSLVGLRHGSLITVR
ncbi:MAG: efflux RND transporter periplasmic adaptor subunit [Prochlorococcaceae cyanobacterium]